MGLIDFAREVKAGKRTLDSLPAGSRKAVQRLLPHVGEAPKPRPFEMRAGREAGTPTRRRL
jgi:hypothetical protein